MTKDRKPIKALIIDDSQDYTRALTLKAAGRQIILRSATNWQQGFEIIKSEKQLQFVILDARCFIHETQEAGTESERFLIKAIKELESWRRDNNRFIPFCVNTGYSDLKHLFENEYNVFSKDHNPDLLFDHIWKEYTQSAIGLLSINYSEPFEFVDQYFSEENKEKMALLCQGDRFLKPGIDDRRKNLADIRIISEHYWDILAVEYLKEDLNRYKDEPSKRTGLYIYKINNGEEKKIPEFIYYWSRTLFDLSSEYAMHNSISDSNLEKLPSKYLIASLTYGLLNAIVWGDQLVKEKKAKLAQL